MSWLFSERMIHERLRDLFKKIQTCPQGATLLLNYMQAEKQCEGAAWTKYGAPGKAIRYALNKGWVSEAVCKKTSIRCGTEGNTCSCHGDGVSHWEANLINGMCSSYKRNKNRQSNRKSATNAALRTLKNAREADCNDERKEEQWNVCVNLRSLQVLVEAFSEENSWDGEPCAQLNVMPTQHKFLRNDKTMEFSNLSRFGLTCEVLTADRGEAVLTSFLEAFPAKTYPQPEKVQESTERKADFGLNLHESFARYDHDSRLWKTPQCSLLEGLDEYLETWPKWGIMQDGVCWEHTTLEPHTDVNGSGFWATPTVNGNYNQKGMSKKSGDGLATMVRNWPTPNSRDWKDTGATQGNRKSPNLGTVVHGGVKTQQKFPTPTSSMMTAADMEQARFCGNDPKRPKYQDAKQGQLNPAWVEWLMGWPINWTSLEPINHEHFEYWKKASTAALCGTEEVRELWWDIDPASTPQEREYYGQSQGEHSNPMCDLPQQGTCEDGNPQEVKSEELQNLRLGISTKKAEGQAMQKPEVLAGIREEVGRVAMGVKHRTDRLKAIGNGQVPLVAATAWRMLTND